MWRVPTGGERSKGTVGVAGGAAALGRTDGGASLSGVQAIRRAGTALRSGVGRPVGGAGGLAGGSLQVRSAGPVAGLAQGGAVSPAALNRKQHAFSDSTGGAGSQEPGLARIGPQSTAAERGLGADLGAPVGAGRDLRGSEAVPRDGVPGLELEAGGTDAGVWALERELDRAARGAEGNAAVSVAGGCARAVAGSGGPAGVGLPGGGSGLREGGVAVVAEAVGRGRGLPAGAGAQAPDGGGGVDLRAGAAGREGGTDGDGTVCEVIDARRVAGTGHLVRPQGELLGSAIAGDHPPGPGTHGPGFSGAAGAALDGSTLPGGGRPLPGTASGFAGRTVTRRGSGAGRR